MDQALNRTTDSLSQKERGQDNQQLQQAVGISERFQDLERGVWINEKHMYHVLEAMKIFSVKFAALQTLFTPNEEIEKIEETKIIEHRKRQTHSRRQDDWWTDSSIHQTQAGNFAGRRTEKHGGEAWNYDTCRLDFVNSKS